MNSFFTIEQRSEGNFKDKGSKFLSFAIPICSVDEAMEFVKQIRKEYFDARHVCYAYMLGAERNIFRTNDDGEPSGTAGKPILGQINSKELTDILVVVVRYFGGTLLGTSGLINAYKSATIDALEQATIVEIPIEKRLKITFGYDNMNFVMRLIKEFDLKILSQEQTDNCLFAISCKQEFWDRLTQRLEDNHLVTFEPLD